MADFREYCGADFSHEFLAHYGKGHLDGGNSGRYPWGSSNNVSNPKVASNRVNVKSLNKDIFSGKRPDILQKSYVVPKGTTLYRTTMNKDEEPSKGMYASYLDADREIYRAGWVRATAESDEMPYEFKYTLNEDIKVPSREELQKIVCDSVRENRDYQKRVVDNYFNTKFDLLRSDALDPGMVDSEYVDLFGNRFGGYSKKKINSYKDEILRDVMSKPVDEAFYYAAQTFGVDKPLRDDILSKVEKAGYNGIVDEYGAKDGASPLILLDGNSVKKMGSTRITKSDEIRSAVRHIGFNQMKEARDAIAELKVVKGKVDYVLQRDEFTPEEKKQAKQLIAESEKVYKSTGGEAIDKLWDEFTAINRNKSQYSSTEEFKKAYDNAWNAWKKAGDERRSKMKKAQ